MELKSCPFCGGEVTIARIGDYITSHYFVTRGNGGNACSCRVFMESEKFTKHSSECEMERCKLNLIKAWNRRVNDG